MSDPPAFAHRCGFVAVLGRPNVGKSTLVNHFLGQKVAIVSPRPQTTRRKQLGILTLPEAQIIFVDTPGLHEPRNALGAYMVAAAGRAQQDADAALFIVDVSVPPGPGDRAIAERLGSGIRAVPIVLALNKSDLVRPEHVIAHSDAYRALLPSAPWLLVSAKRGDNLDELLTMIVQALPEGTSLYPEDEVTQTHLRDLAAELIREAALNALEQEVPYGVAVEIEEFREAPGRPTYIGAKIHVERDSHKGIVIGRGGRKLKQIGSAARAEIERLLEQKVFLDLHVTVSKDWRKDERDVRRLGYRDE